MFIWFDPWYILYVMIPAMLIGGWATMRMKSAYKRASKIASRSGLTGAQAAARIMLQAGHDHVAIEESRGLLSDHYDPRKKVLRLSPDVYHGQSLAALGIAAHEAGHALQDAQNYAPLVIRNAIVPTAAIGSNLGMFLIFGGWIFAMPGLMLFGVALYSLIIVSQLINLPCEFNASTRARQQLLALNMVTEQEDVEVKKVLDGAAMTYVAALVTSIMVLLYYLWRLGILGGD